MPSGPSPDLRPIRVRYYVWAATVLWSLVCFMVTLRQLADGRHNIIAQASYQARTAFEKDQLYSRWLGEHGGVYVRVSDQFQPNPFLAFRPERDITTPSGRLLTLVDPTTVTREVHDLGREVSGVVSHVTGWNPINPVNAPDAWEKEALTQLEQGEEVVNILQDLDGKAYFRQMHPLVAHEYCLPCHGNRGFKVGEVGGGISVSVPMEPLLTIAGGHNRAMMVSNAVVWLLGMIGIGLAAGNLSRRVKQIRQAQAARLESESKYRQLVELSPDAIGLQHQNKIKYMNPAGLQLFAARNEEELIGKSIWDFAPPQDRSLLQERIHKISNEVHEGKMMEQTFRRLDGTSVDVELTTIPVTFEGQPAIQAIFRDITEQKEHETEREQLLWQIAEKHRELEQVLYISSHDLRAPLISIQGFTAVLTEAMGILQQELQDEQITGEIRDRVQQLVEGEIQPAMAFISEGTSRMDALLAGLLRLSRITGTVTQVRPVDMNAIVAQILQDDQIRAKAAEVALEVESLPVCRGNQDQLRQVLYNLVNNAVNFLDSDRSGEIRISGWLDDGVATYCVQDNGIGISAKNQIRVFDIFCKLDPESRMGEGLGLAIAKKIIERHNGKIWVESEESRGSKFIFSVPE